MIHGFVDVPLHRVELGWWVFVLAGLAFGNPALTHTEKSRVWLAQRLIFGICGAALLAGGFILIQSQWFQEYPFPPYRGRQVVEQIRELNSQGRSKEAASLDIRNSLSARWSAVFTAVGYSEIMRKGDPEIVTQLLLPSGL
jgi:hypothetical protein